MCVIYEKMLPLSSKLSFNEDFKQSISNKNLDISLTENDEQFLLKNAELRLKDLTSNSLNLNNSLKNITKTTQVGTSSPLQMTSFSSITPNTSHQQQYLTANNDPCAHVVHVLFCYHQGGEDPDFIRKAIESLVKKLKDRRTQLDALISAITSGGKQPTSCVTIHRSLDGRLQVAGRKGVPHVVYARIWRWPNVNKNELQKLPICTISMNHPDLICINPFHYDRVVSSGIGNIEMSSSKLNSLSEIGINFNQAISPNYYSMRNYTLINNESNLNSFEQQSIDWQKQYALNEGVLNNTNPINAHRFQNTLGVQSYNNLRFPEHWCSILYYELDTQVGETFKASRDMSEVVIDGGMDPSGARSGRFCLGALSNVHRTEASEKARIHIGKGVKLKTSSDGSVYLECLSNKGVFVRSYYLDYEHGLIYGSTVHKINSGAEKKLFDLRWAFAEMCEQRESAQMAVVAQAYAVAGIVQRVAPSLIERAGIGLDDLRRVCCTIAISFVKGWGSGYNRSSIKETPCWVEIHLNRSLQLLNILLQKS